MKQSSISLIGMPTSGKSYLGKRLAQQLDLNFIDFDDELIKLYGPIKSIIEEHGEHRVLEYEEKLMLGVQAERNLFSCGGSSVYSDMAMEHLSEISAVIYLEVPLGILRQRMDDYIKRGVIGARNKTLEELYDERTPLYEKFAEYTIFEESGDMEKQYERLLKLAGEVLDVKT